MNTKWNFTILSVIIVAILAAISEAWWIAIVFYSFALILLLIKYYGQKIKSKNTR